MSIHQRAVILSLTVAVIGLTQTRPLEQAQTIGNLKNPAQQEWSESVVSRLRAPEGFRIAVFATRLGNPRMMAVSEAGTVYVTRRNTGDVVMLKDNNGDGVADFNQTVARDINYANGLLIDGNRVWIAGDRDVWSGSIAQDGSFENLRRIIADLPDAGQHPNRTLGIGPDGMLYITVGSTCNSCRETNRENATLLRAALDGSQRQVFAEGLRNTLGFGWHPATGDLWGLDMGSDWRGDTLPPDEVNRISRAQHYGWPYCYSTRQIDRHIAQPPPGRTREEFCADTTPSLLDLEAHASPTSMLFYSRDMFPAEYRGDALIAFHGSWNRETPAGYKISRLRFSGGTPTEVQDFITGWLSEDRQSHYGRPTGLAVHPDGSLFISDDSNGVIYRVSMQRR